MSDSTPATAAGYAAIKVWGGITGDVWAQCGVCHETYPDAESLDALVRWADGHNCRHNEGTLPGGPACVTLNALKTRV